MRAALTKQTIKKIYGAAAWRYDFQHSFFTARTDQRGRALIAEKAVRPGDQVLDCGAGTGSTALLAAQAVGPRGRVTLFDLSENMLAVARKRLAAAGLAGRCTFVTGDMETLPFPDASFDAVLSTYSVCPLTDPDRGAVQLYRVLKPGGRLGVAHSAAPERPLVKWLAEKTENVVWLLPAISLGCRPVSVLSVLERAGARVRFKKRIGVPLWPFLVFVVEKSQANAAAGAGTAETAG